MATPAQDPPGLADAAVTDQPVDHEASSAQPPVNDDFSGLVKYKIEYRNLGTGVTAFGGDKEKQPASESEPPVMEYIEVRLTTDPVTSSSESTDVHQKHENHSKGQSYIKILSRAVNEALRCVVDYFPTVDLSGKTITVKEPFEIFVTFERELAEYRNRVECDLSDERLASCPNRYASKHIGIVQEFVKRRVREDVEAERERHSRGFATFDMLWLLFRPGSDVYLDIYGQGEHEPCVVRSLEYELSNGSTNVYDYTCWNIDAGSNWMGPTFLNGKILRFAGEKQITELALFPCEYLRFAKDLGEGDVDKIRKHFTARGKKWFDICRSKKCYMFDGYTWTTPRRKYAGLAMVDSFNYEHWKGSSENDKLCDTVAHPSTPHGICACDRCAEQIYRRAVKPKFAGYSKFQHSTVEKLTDHQYFICSRLINAFVFKLRSWQKLQVQGFQEASFDKSLFDHLVMKERTKGIIKNLTEMYIRDSTKQSQQAEDRSFVKISSVHKEPGPVRDDTTWSADFVQGKGQGLTILLHGKPGVGKTYTAECIAEFTGRPLLPLTCSDVGVEPEQIEKKLVDWFKLAENWGAIVLIDEADVYMEERQTQDLTRNHLVAGFLCALEYFKGILFLTTNRVGTFDEAFISRIHMAIYYPDFGSDNRVRVWNNFFEKLEKDREATMRVLESAKDYVQSAELQELKWNGREIRNAIQVAVALAEARGERDNKNRVLVKREHIKATVDMSKEFRDYLVHVHKIDLSKRAAIMGTRFDAYDPATSKDAKPREPDQMDED